LLKIIKQINDLSNFLNFSAINPKVCRLAAVNSTDGSSGLVRGMHLPVSDCRKNKGKDTDQDTAVCLKRPFYAGFDPIAQTMARSL
jgi:hypothetical protein